MEHHETLQSLMLITLLAVSVPVAVRLLGRHVKLPIVVGEILAGMVVGRSGLDLLTETPVLRFVSEFGFIFLMFLSGLEMDFRVGRGTNGGGLDGPPPSRWRRPGSVAILYFGLTLLLAMLAGVGLWGWGMAHDPLLIGLILSTTSLGIVVPILKERDLAARPYGQLLLRCAFVSDFASLLLLSLVVSVISRGFGLDLLLFVVLLASFALAARVGPWMARHTFIRRLVKELSHATSQIRIRWAFALMVLWVVLAGTLGVEVILGAFLAGAIISQSRQTGSPRLQEKLDAIGYGFFIPIFFITVGARFDLAAVLSSRTTILLVPLLIVAAYVVKMVPSLLFRNLFSGREALAAGALLSSRLSLVIAASAIALDLDLISSATNSAIILLAIVTCTGSPLLFNRILPPRPEEARRGVIILGTDSLAELLGKRLLHSGDVVTFIGRDAARLERLQESGCKVVPGPPDDEQVLARAAAGKAQALVALSNDPAVVLRACRLAREQFAIPVVVARGDDPEQVRQLKALNVRVVQPGISMALGLEGALHFPAAFAMLTDQNDEFELADATIENPQLAGMPLRQVHLPDRAFVLGIRRQGEGEIIVPHGDTLLNLGDVLMLSGHPRALRETSQWFADRSA